MASTELEVKVLAALRANTEGCDITDDEGCTWSTVYLDNAAADISPRLSEHQFAGVLGSLQQKQLYRPIDECFGDVLVREVSLG